MRWLQKGILLQISLLGLLHPAIAVAQSNFVVNLPSFNGTTNGQVDNTYTPPAVTGDLLYVISQINAGSGTTGTAASNNNVVINPGISTITINQNMPILQNGMTLSSSNSGGTTIVSGTNSNPNLNNGNNFSMFATRNASLSLSNITLQGGVASGGAGAGLSTAPVGGGGGGGGLAAGGAIYIDPQQTLLISGVTITGCSAIGGPGGFGNPLGTGTGGGGGGASFSITQTPSISTTGGGDYPGANPLPSSAPPILNVGSGYGGGAGGTGNTGTGGLSGGPGVGGGAGNPTVNPATQTVVTVPISNTVGGNAGYCGGGGGGGAYGGGGGGGNPGGYGNLYPLLTQTNGGGAGGGYGSGGAGGWQIAGGSSNGGGGGGGFGGGGGGAGNGGADSGGGGGGGFGAGGGGGGLTAGSAGAGGNFGGSGGGGIQGGGGGGGAGIGGAIFVGDGATVQIGDGVNIPPGGNFVIGGTAGSAGSSSGTGYATDIFLFQGASAEFVGTIGYVSSSPFASAIQSDNTVSAFTTPSDAGVVINTTTTTTPIYLTSTLSNYVGGTSIQQGYLYVSGANLPPTGNINISSTGTLYLTGVYTPTVSVTNAGNINVSGGAFTIPTSFNNTGALFVVGSGSLVGTITSGTSLSIGQDSLRVASANAFTANNPITVNNVNVYNTSSLTTVVGGSVTANLFMNGTSTFSGSNISGSILSIGIDSFGNQSTGTSILITQPITATNFPLINVNTGTLNSNGNAISVNNINVYNASSLISSGGGAIVTGGLFMNGTSTFTGNVSGTTLTTGLDSNNNSFSTSFNASQPISTFPTIRVNAGTFSTNGNAITNLTAFNTSSGTTTTIDTPISGAGGTLTNAGTLNNTVVGGLTNLTGLFTNTGTLATTQNLTLNNTINSSGTISANAGTTLTINGALNIYNNAILNGTIAGGGGSSLTIGQDSLSNPYPSTNATINSAISAIPSFAVVNGTVTTNGIITGVNSAFSIASGATANINAAFSGTVAATNAGTLTTSATVNFTSYTNTGHTNFIITNDTVFGSINTTGATNLGALNSIHVTSNFIFAVANHTYTWPVVTAASITPNPVFYDIPPNTISDTWTLTQNATSIVVQLLKQPLPIVNPIIGPVLYEMSLGPTNDAEFTLLNALGNAPTDQQYFDLVNELIPDLNSLQVNIMKQDVVFRQVEHRIHSVRMSIAANDIYGIATGDIGQGRIVWAGPFGSIANQDPETNNFGYRAYSGGVIGGLDIQTSTRELYGLAFAYSTTNVQTKLIPGLNTRIDGYHLLFYGSHELGKAYNNFFEWMFNLGINANYSNKRIFVSGLDFSTNASYRDQQFGFLVNYGREIRTNKYCYVTPMASLQYNYINSPAFDESSISPAALHMDGRTGQVLTLLAGGETMINIATTWFKGNPVLSAMVGYDVISSGNTTTSNFLVGGSSFTYSSQPARLSLSLGADCSFEMDERTIFQFIYELQLRQGYVANAVTAKIKFLF